MRAPFQTLIILYKIENDKIEYGTFLRKKQQIWQFASGGGESQETPIETVIRELKEETNLEIKENDITKLESISTIPVINITGSFTWGENVFVVPEYCFAVNSSGKEIILSSEHKEFEWLGYEEAIKKLEYDSNKTALWELNEKIKRGN